MVNLWTLLLALVPAASALIAAFMTNKATERRIEIQSRIEINKERDRIKLIKAEEVYSDILLYKKKVFLTHIDWVNFSYGLISMQQLDSNTLKESEGEKNTIISTKLSLYFPKLYEKFDEAQRLLVPAGDCYVKMRFDEKITTDEKKSFAPIILKSGESFDKSIADLLQQLSREVRNLHEA